MSDTFGGLLRTARKNAGLTQRELAVKVGIDFTYVSKMEGNKLDRPPAELTLKKIANALDLNPHQEFRMVDLSGRTVEVPIAEYRKLHNDILQLRHALRKATEIVHINGPAHTDPADVCSIAQCAYTRGLLAATNQYEHEGAASDTTS